MVRSVYLRSQNSGLGMMSDGNDPFGGRKSGMDAPIVDVAETPIMLWLHSFVFKPAQVAPFLSWLCARNVNQNSHKLFYFFFFLAKEHFLKIHLRDKKEVYLSHHLGFFL